MKDGYDDDLKPSWEHNAGRTKGTAGDPEPSESCGIDAREEHVAAQVTRQISRASRPQFQD